MVNRHKKLFNALLVSSVLLLSYQNVFWVTFNPFQSGIEELDLDRKISMMLEEPDDTAADRASLHLGMPHHTSIPHNHGNNSFCLSWRSEDALNRTLQPFDYWWTHHPTWVISKETDDMFCVEPGRDEATMRAFQKFYNTQFKTGCDKIHWRIMWSSGWGADMMNVQVRVLLNVYFGLVFYCPAPRLILSSISVRTHGIHGQTTHPISNGIVGSAG